MFIFLSFSLFSLYFLPLNLEEQNKFARLYCKSHPNEMVRSKHAIILSRKNYWNSRRNKFLKYCCLFAFFFYILPNWWVYVCMHEYWWAYVCACVMCTREKEKKKVIKIEREKLYVYMDLSMYKNCCATDFSSPNC